jgi:hypothetical protein
MKMLAHRLGSAWIWALLAVTQLVILLWWSRWIVDVKFDRQALTNLYDHSQWVVPQSPRLMGDAELYQVGGDVLWRTGEFFRVNPETPPVGKYLYGAAINLTNRPYAGSVVSFASALLLVAAVCFQIFPRGSRRRSIAISYSLLLANQLFSSQLTQTMLDIPQLCGFLLFILGLITYKKTTKNVFLALTSLGLAIFIGAKIGAMAPILLIGGAFILPPKRWEAWISMLAMAGLIYMAFYSPYFLQGHSLIEWLKTQKWMIEFYRSSDVTFFGFNLPAVIFTGWHWGWWNKSWGAVGEWSMLWPITFGSLLLGWRQWRTLDNSWRSLLVMSSLFLVSFIIFPFWPRYLILILPIAVFFLARSVDRFPLTHQLTAAVGILLLTLSSQLPLAKPVAAQLADRWSAQAYLEIYGTLSESSQLELPHETFTTLLATAEQGMQSEKITSYVELNQKNLWPSQVSGTLYLVRQTPLGLFTHAQPIQLIRERGRWRVSWDWELVAPFYEPGAHFTIIEEQLPFGTVRTADKVEVIQPGQREILFVQPTGLKDVDAEIHELELLTGQHYIGLRAKMFVTAYDAPWVKIGPLIPGLDEERLEAAKTHPAYRWSEEPSFTFLEELRGIDAAPWLNTFVDENPRIQSLSAGSLLLTLPDESVKILKETEGKKGEDILLSETYEELQERIERELR